MEHSMYYNFAFIKTLVKKMELDGVSSIRLCVYTINTSGKYPFLQYLLDTNNMNYNLLSLPDLNFHSSFDDKTKFSYVKTYLYTLLQSENYEEFDKQIIFDGFHNHENKIHLYFNATKCNINIDELYSSTEVRFALIDEIVNSCYVCNKPIVESTTNYFKQNWNLYYLYDEKYNSYEVPIVSFVGKQTVDKFKFVHVFGESPKNKSAILGPFYYFTDYDNAITGNNIGVVRFALFTGKTYYIENMPNKAIDESEIKKQRLNDDSLDRNYEIQTLKISDHDGTWASLYDSAYLGEIELDDGSFIKDASLIVLKDYNQQTVLSSHLISRS